MQGFRDNLVDSITGKQQSSLHLTVFDGLMLFQHKEGNLDVGPKCIFNGLYKELLLVTGPNKYHYLMHG